MFLIPLLIVTDVLEAKDKKYYETLKEYKLLILITHPLMILAALVGLLEGILY